MRTRSRGSTGVPGSARPRRVRRACSRGESFTPRRTIGAVASGDDLRGLMRYWPHGVAVLTVEHESQPMGVTVSSLVSLSLEPPLVGVALGQHSAALELLREAGRCAFSLLSGEQETIAQHFARGVPPI